jgi:F-type H+-transporting ATPase subunit b
MNLNLTLLGQMLTFAVFVWFTMKYVWPPMTKALNARQKTIADGLAAAEQGERSLELADRKAQELLRESKLQASQILEEANKRADHIMEEAREAAREDGQRIVAHAHEQIEQEVVKAKESLRDQVGQLAVSAAEKIIKRSVDGDLHKDLIDQAIKEI